jgi:hypothetical protein
LPSLPALSPDEEEEMSISSVGSTIRDLPRVLQAARQHPGDRFLSVYLDTSPARAIGRGHLVAFHDACKTLRSRQESPVGDDLPRFEAAVAQVDAYLATLSPLGAPGLAIFATGEGTDVIATPLPLRPLDRVVWAPRPAIEPLAAALDEYERVAVLLVDKERSRLFTVYLGEIEERQVLVDEVPGKQDTGDWFALSQKRFERHHEDHVLRHVKRTIRALSDELETHPFDRIFIGGTDEAVALLVNRLPRRLRGRLAGNLSLPLYASDTEVLTAALAAAEAAERREEAEVVQTLIDAETTPHVSLGLESTLGALAAGRVHRLFVAADLDLTGARCETCGRMTVDFARCPACGGTIRPIADLKEEAIQTALAQDARVEFVSGQASTRLMERGGLGALTRY